jgi:tRNA-dihydrouridine synthase B
MKLLEQIKKFPFVLAPLAGYTDHPLRMLCRQYGASLTFTEMINVHSMVKNRTKITQMLFYTREEKPVGIQLFGNDARRFHDAAQAAEGLGFDLVDINFGCPVNKVIRAYGGAYLHKDLPAVEATIKAVVEAVKIPVSIKMRSGWEAEHINFRDIAKIAEDNGVSIITLHPRTRAQMFTGSSNWEHIKELKQASKCFIIGNGDVTGRESALKMKQETGCDAVMIGRAAIGNPFIFRQIADPAYGPSSKEMFETAIKHFEMLWDIAGPRAALEIRKYYKHYIKDFTGAADIRRMLMTMTGRDEIIGYIKELMRGTGGE